MGGALRPPFSAKLFRAVADRVGKRAEQAEEKILQSEVAKAAPVEKRQRLYALNDGSMLPALHGEWKEAKVGVLFRDHDHLSRREKKRGAVTQARYVAVWGNQEEFRTVMRAALDVEQWHTYEEVVWLGDGARGNWILAETLCPTAIQILDIGHAIENGMKCGKAMLGESDPALRLWEKRIRQLIDAGDVDAMVHELMDCLPETTHVDQVKALDSVVGYYRHNQDRMDYPRYRAMDLMIGSGVVESAHRHVLQSRMKRAGQHWSDEHGRRMVKLRAVCRTAGVKRMHASINRSLVKTHVMRQPLAA